MNLHCPQSIQTMSELKDFANVPYHIIGPKDGKPVIEVVQDTMLGSFRLTKDHVRIHDKTFANLQMVNSYFDGVLPKATDSKNHQYSGLQASSQILPPGFHLELKNKLKEKVKIVNGVHQSGILDKSIYHGMSTGILPVIYHDYSPFEVRRYLDNLQRLICRWLLTAGFSVGISDLVVDATTKDKIKNIITSMKTKAYEEIGKVRQGQLENNSIQNNQDYFEQQMIGILNGATSEIEKNGLESIHHMLNRMMNMVQSGSKGKPTNVAQMIACVGQQNVDGKRVAYGFTDRTLPHYCKYDDGPEARGFVGNSFISGLTPQEMFFHAMGGREGLIDTAVKTSETGYLQRKLVKAMEDNKVYYDQTVRNANEGIVQFLYGEDGMEGTKIEAQNLNYIDMDLLDIEKEHRMYFEETFKMYLTEKVFTDTMKSSTIRKRCEEHFQQLLEDRLFLIEKVFKNQKMDRITYPIPFERIIKNAVHRMKDMGLDSLPSNLSPGYILDEIEELISGKTCLKVTTENQGMKFLHILLRMHLSPKPMIYKYHMQKETFDWILSEIRRYFKEAITPAGEMVGIIAAQSLGEPATQLTLDSFHVSGTAAAVKATSGVPRLKELLSVSKNIKTPTLQIYLKPDISHTVNATEDQQGNINDPRVYEAKERTFKVLKQLEITKLVDLLETTEIFWDPPGQKGLQTNIENDNQYLAIYREFTKLDSSRCRSTSPWVLRMVLDKTRVYRANLSMLDIYMKIYQAYGNTIECLFSDDNDEELIFQMRINENALKDVDSEDMVAALKAIEYNIVHTILLKGVTKINKVSMRVYNHIDYNKDKQQFDKINEWILDTDGSNLIEIMANPNVDPYRTFTNDIHEIFNVLGIEAARNALSNEIMEVIKESSVNYRHLSLLMDTMTCKGALMSVDRHGINRGDVGPLAKSSFEETTDMLIKSSIFSEFDRINGVSANIMLGQLPPCGTGDSEILLDEQDYISLVKDRINYIPSAGMEEVDACHMEALKFNLPNVLTQQKTKMSELPEVTFV
jgi:DNA-directed RNA polymerase II subunit RPB1